MSSNNVLLIYPIAPVMNREDRCQQPTNDLIVIPPLPPSDLLYIAAIARNAGKIPVVRDYSLIDDAQNQFIKDLNELKPEYVVINITSTNYYHDMLALKTINDISPESKVIIKGAKFLGEYDDITALEKYKSLDIVIRGEVEETIKDIFENKPLSEILGITYRNGAKIIKNPQRPFIENLDSIPYPARDLIDNSKYIRPDTGEMQAVIKVSRGCPYHCFFCLATPVSGVKVRTRSPENILGEIKECYEKFGIKNFIFWSDIFNQDNEWVKALCKAIIDSGLKITFSTNTRADTADIETVKLMKQAGCSLVSIGIESGSNEILQKIGKRITTEHVKNTVKMFKRLGIKIYAYYVIGLPWETKKTYRETMDFAKYLNTEFASFYTATPLSGTKFREYAEKNHLLVEDFDEGKSYYEASANTHELNTQQVFDLVKNAYREYYIRPSYVLMMLFKIKSLNEFKNYFKAGLRVLFKR